MTKIYAMERLVTGCFEQVLQVYIYTRSKEIDKKSLPICAVDATK